MAGRIRKETVIMDIKELRTKLGLSQQDLAVVLGVSITTIRYWEYGTTKPSRMARARLQKFLKQQGIDDEELIRWAKIR